MAQAASVPGPSQDLIGSLDEYSDEQFVHVIGSMWDLNVTVQDLKQPKADLVQQIYFYFLRETGINLDKYNQIPHQLLDSIQYPDEYMGTLRLTMLAVDLRKCFKLIFEDDTFRLVDLFNPKPKRTKRYFALIYDYLLFYNDIVGEVVKMEEEVNALVDQRNKFRAKLDKIKQRIHDKRTENEKNDLAKDEEVRRFEAKREELENCQKEKVALKAKFDALGLSLTNVDIGIKDTELRILEANTEKQRLEDQVIQPNEEQEIKKRDEKLALLQNENLKKKDHLVQLQQKISVLNTTKENLDKIMSLLQEIQQEKLKEKDIQASVQQLLTQITELQEEIKDQSHQNQQLTQQLAASESKLQNVHQVWELRQESLNKDIKEQKQVLEDIQRNQTEQDIVRKEVSDDVAELDEQIRQSKEEVRNINTMIQSNFKCILDAMEEGNAELMAALTKVANCVEEFKVDE